HGCMGNGRSSHRTGCSVRRRSWSASIPIMDVLRKLIGLFPKKLRDHALGQRRHLAIAALTHALLIASQLIRAVFGVGIDRGRGMLDAGEALAVGIVPG